MRVSARGVGPAPVGTGACSSASTTQPSCFGSAPRGALRRRGAFVDAEELGRQLCGRSEPAPLPTSGYDQRQRPVGYTVSLTSRNVRPNVLTHGGIGGSRCQRQGSIPRSSGLSLVAATLDLSARLSWQRRAGSCPSVLDARHGNNIWNCGWVRTRALAAWGLQQRLEANRPTCAGNVAHGPRQRACERCLAEE